MSLSTPALLRALASLARSVPERYRAVHLAEQAEERARQLEAQAKEGAC